jgi:hypothetical protein
MCQTKCGMHPVAILVGDMICLLRDAPIYGIAENGGALEVGHGRLPTNTSLGLMRDKRRRH